MIGARASKRRSESGPRQVERSAQVEVLAVCCVNMGLCVLIHTILSLCSN